MGNILLQGNVVRTKKCWCNIPTTGQLDVRGVPWFYHGGYIDDMLVKSLYARDHTTHLKQAFEALDQHQMKLNPTKCTFGVGSGQFLGYLVTQQGIESNPQQIRALIDMPSPKSIKDVQRLNGRIAALSRFISKSSDHCVSFFKALKGKKNFEWTPECEDAF